MHLGLLLQMAADGMGDRVALGAQADGLVHLVGLLICIALVSAVLWWLLRISHALGERISTTGLNIATRLLGLILAAIAIETMADGLKALFPALA